MTVPLSYLESLSRWPLEGKALPLEPSPGGARPPSSGRPDHVDNRHEDQWRALEAERRLREVARVSLPAERVLRAYYVTWGPSHRDGNRALADVWLAAWGLRLTGDPPPEPGPRPRHKRQWAAWDRVERAHQRWQADVSNAADWARRWDVVARARAVWQDAP